VRQIAEDPQSPPCLSSGPDARGRDSAPGIVDDKIRVAYPAGTQFGMGNNGPEIQRVWKGMAKFFTDSFMLYGRQIELVPYTTQGGSGNANPVLTVADADKVADMNVFAALGYSYDVAGSQFFDRLAERGVVSATGVVPSVEEAHFAAEGRDPYQWSYTPTLGQMLRSAGRFACNQLEGKAPQYAGDPIAAGIDRSQPRKFGLIVTKFTDSNTDVAPLEQTLLAECGVRIDQAARVEALYSPASLGEATTAVARLMASDVTTVICVCHVNAARLGFQAAAEQQGYRPEWFFTSFMHNDFQSALAFTNPNAAPGTTPPGGVHDQMAHSFGLSFRPKAVPVDELPITRALKLGYGSDFDWTVINKGVNGGFPPEWSGQFYNWTYYKALLVLASGFQMAGPELTPETFARGRPDTPWPGLQGTRFPNPDTGDYAGRVGFANDHSMVDDATVIWWSWDHDEVSTWGNEVHRANGDRWRHSGAWCYADHGRRYGFGDLAGAAPTLFTGPGSDCY